MRKRRSLTCRARLTCPYSPLALGRTLAKMRLVPRRTIGPFCSSKVTGPQARAIAMNRQNSSWLAAGCPAR